MSARPLRGATRLLGAAVIAMALAHGAPLRAAAADAPAHEQDATALAKETQNPVANLISVPFQNNFNFNAGSKNRMVWFMNVEPVIPIPLNEDWNLITRTIVPIINEPSLFPGMDGAFGMGDINPSVFLSPASDEHLVWGVGVTTTLPTATVNQLSSGQWSMGPTAVGVWKDGPWVVGALANQQWSMVGWKGDYNHLLVQPFVNYNLSDGWYLVSAPIITGDFATGGGNHWTVPVGGGVGKVWRIGKVGLPLNTQIVPFYNAVTPDFGPDWQLRFQFAFLFPR
ncbi:neuromedin U [bacterium]|nr:neuromedin U [bacterium]